jgi:drug/metabolite transporter (DMT)-like permease
MTASSLSSARVFTGTSLAMLAFAGNSVLCRLALSHTPIDPASFTAIRLLSGAIVLWVAVRVRGESPSGSGNWVSAFALLAYAAGFSFAYVGLSAATGALLLFGAVQGTMLGVGILRGERLNVGQIVGVLLAVGGLIVLLLPGLSAPPLSSAALMVGAGIAWGVYSLRGQGAGDSTKVTAGNFLRAAPAALVVGLTLPHMPLDRQGMAYAVLSGALASGLGYTLWYTVLPSLRATTAAVVQLSVPVIATLSGSALLDEAITHRVMLASGAILGGIAVVVLARRRN